MNYAKLAGEQEKRRVYRMVNKAVRDGLLVPPDRCSDCGELDRKGRDGRRGIQAHHHNGYDRPLDVQWLCVSCHARQHDHGYQRGENNDKSILTDEAVIEILSSTESDVALAKRFGVWHSAIAKVRSGESWKHITGGKKSASHIKPPLCGLPDHKIGKNFGRNSNGHAMCMACRRIQWSRYNKARWANNRAMLEASQEKP